ncbi:MAG: archaeosortase/exosortase family protein [Verrucomicrobiota bacterium]
MTRHSTYRTLGAAGLVLGAGLVWTRDMSWIDKSADMLPLAAGFQLAAWLGGPWQMSEDSQSDHPSLAWPILAGLVFAVAWILPSLTLLALSWTALAAYWMRRWCQPQTNIIGLLLILALSFPWMVIEWPQIGWWFRLSAAASVEGFFNLLQMPVERHGTELLVLGESIHIEPACAGWNMLQLTLLAGAAIGVHDISKRPRFLIFLLLLPALAWLANFLRILLLSALSLTFGLATAEGVWHGMTGLLVIAVVLGMAKLLCRALDPDGPVTIRRSHSQ